MPIKLRSGSWKDGNSIYLRVSGAWKSINSGYIRISGSWKQFFASTVIPSTEAPSEITLSAANATTGLRTLTGKHYHWLNTTSLFYKYERSTDNINWNTTPIASGTAINPGSGSNTNAPVSPTLNQSQVQANTTNYYRYVTTAQNSTYGTSASSESNSVTIEGARNISGLTASGQTTNSVNLSWNASLGANSYRVYYGYPSGSYGLTIDTSLTSITISGLLSDTTYFFAVRPYTGSIVSGSVTGYEGNLSTEVSRKTDAPPPTPQLSSPTGFQVYNYDPTTGEIEVKWNAVTNATNYWIFMYSGSTTNPNSLMQSADNGNMLTWSPIFPQFLSAESTYTFAVFARASGYLDSPTVTITYTTPKTPVAPTSSSGLSVGPDGSGTFYIIVNTVTGGTTNYYYYLDRYLVALGAPTNITYYHSPGAPAGFTGIPPGTANDFRIYGSSIGIVNGVNTVYLSSNFHSPSPTRYIVVGATALPGADTTTAFSISKTTNSISYSRIPATVATQGPWYATVLFRWNGSSWVFQATQFHRIDGSNFQTDAGHITGYGFIPSITGTFTGLSSGSYLVECRVWNNLGYNTTNSGSLQITL